MRKLQAGSPCGEAGQTLMEILLAFSVAVLILSAIVIVVITSLSNAQYTKNQNLANSYAREGMAVIKKLRDSSWIQFSSLTYPNYCLGPTLTLTEASPLLLCRQNGYLVGEIFSREVNFVHNSLDCSSGSKATVTVSWADSKCPVGNSLCHNVQLITCFSSIDQKQAP